MRKIYKGLILVLVISILATAIFAASGPYTGTGDAQITVIDNALANLQTQINSLTARITNLENKPSPSGIDNTLATLTTRITNLENKPSPSGIDNTLANLQTQINSLTTRITNLENKPSISAYTTKFSKDIYVEGPAICKEWSSYSLDLQSNSYVNIGMGGTIIADIGANAYTNWILVTDDGGNCGFNDGKGQAGTFVDNYGMNSGLYMQMHAQDTFYLTKGQHTIYLYGQAMPTNGKYTVSGSLNIIAIPKI